MNEISHTRRPRAYLSEFGTNQIHLRNPLIAAFWSFAFPGCGHLSQGRLLKGFILIVWELLVNGNAKINLSIMYSLLGDFDMAIQVINPRWFFLYVSLYVYAIWDCYRGTVDLNKLYILVDREDAPIKPIFIKQMDINFLDKRNPLVASILSLLSPGLGHMYVHRAITGLFFITWTITVFYFSHALPALYETMLGNFSHAKAAVDMQWLMYIPSIYGFVIHDAYVTTVEHNKLLEKVQSRFLRDHFQRSEFKMPL